MHSTLRSGSWHYGWNPTTTLTAGLVHSFVTTSGMTSAPRRNSTANGADFTTSSKNSADLQVAINDNYLFIFVCQVLSKAQYDKRYKIDNTISRLH